MFVARRIASAILISLALSSTARATPVLTLAGPGALEVGASGDYIVGIAGLFDGAAPSLGAFDLEVTFDPTALELAAVTFGDSALGDQLDLFGLGSVQGADFLTPSQLEVFELSLDSADDLNALQAGNFTLLTLNLKLLRGGTTSLGFGGLVTLSDADGNRLQASMAPAISVTAVPEPGTFVLVAIGGGTFVRRRLRAPSETRAQGNVA
jgi:hypothetical protein